MEEGHLLENSLRDYMLGQLSASEEKRFEEQLMNDDQLFGQVGALVDLVEDDLVEEYLQDDLDDSERKSFELRLLGSPKIREKLMLERALIQRATETGFKRTEKRQAESRVKWLRSWVDTLIQPVPAVAAFLFVLLLGGGFWSATRISRLEGQLSQASSQQALLVETQERLERQLLDERQRTDRFASELESARGRSASLEKALDALRDRLVSPIVSALLKPGLYRGDGQVGTLRVSGEHQLVELQLDLGFDEYPSYRAALCNAAGDEITVQSRLKAVHKGEEVLVVAEYPARALSPGNYHVKLSGVAQAGELEQLDLYHFRVRAE